MAVTSSVFNDCLIVIGSTPVTLDSTSYHHGIYIRSNAYAATLCQQIRNRRRATREPIPSHSNFGSIPTSRRKDPHLSSRQRLHTQDSRRSRPIQRLRIPLRARPRRPRSSVRRKETHRHRSTQQAYSGREKQVKGRPLTIRTPSRTTRYPRRTCSSRILLPTSIP